MARFPEWTPLALVGAALVGFAASILLWDLARGNDALFVLPFGLAGLALLSVPLSEPGRLRTTGLALAVAFALSPAWWPFVHEAAQDAGAETLSSLSAHAFVLEGEGPYRLEIALPQKSGEAAPVYAHAVGADGPARVEPRGNRFWLVLEGEGDLSVRWTERHDGWYPEWQGYNWPTTEPRLSEGNVSVAFVAEYAGQGLCTGWYRVAGTADPADAEIRHAHKAFCAH